MKIKTLIGSIIVLLLLGSCMGSPTVWDSSIPENRLTTVRFISMNIESFNGIDVTKFRNVQIPAGQARMSGEVYVYHAGLNFRLSGMEFTYNFEAGKIYDVQGAAQNMVWGVNIFEMEGSRRNLITFIPFREQPVF